MEKPKHTPGRPPHIPTEMQRRLVTILTAEGVPQNGVCHILNISEKTLRRRYRRELNIGAARLEAALALRLLELASGNGPVALQSLKFVLQSRFGWSAYAPPPPRSGAPV